MKLVEKLQTEPVQLSSETVRNKRIPVEDFPLFTTEEPVECLLAFIVSCVADGIPLPPNLLEQASQPAPEFTLKKRRRKRKASEEGSPKKKEKRVKKKDISISDTHVLETVITPPTSHHSIPSEQIQSEPQQSQVSEPPHQTNPFETHQQNLSEQNTSDPIPSEPEQPHHSEPTPSETH